MKCPKVQPTGVRAHLAAVAKPYYTLGEYQSFMLTDCDPAVLQAIARCRGHQYLPRDMGGAGGFIADTDINLVIPANNRLSDVKEQSPWDCARVPGHKLGNTAHFFVTKRGDAREPAIVLSGWIVPYHRDYGVPMEGRRNSTGNAKPYYDWTSYMNGEDSYLSSRGMTSIPWASVVEIGRLCGPRVGRQSRSYLPVFLAFKTLHRFLGELGIDNYLCAAIEERGKRYASLYEGMGLRKIRRYPASTVVGIERRGDGWRPVTRVLQYWAMHMNVPDTQDRIRNRCFGNPETPGAARLDRKALSFVTPYLFQDRADQWGPISGKRDISSKNCATPERGRAI